MADRPIIVEHARRALADVATADGQSAAELLLTAGLARPYGGGRRLEWCD